MEQSISDEVAYLVERHGISQGAAQAILVHLKPSCGHTANPELARKTIQRFAREHGIRVEEAETMFRSSLLSM